MKNTFGNNLSVSIFGESHGEMIGALLDGIAPGVDIDREYIRKKLGLRRSSALLSTARREGDEFRIVSGVVNDKTTGTPICILIPNTNTQSKDYSKFDGIARPGHADYTAFMKYHGFEDRRGGGHFSGRITAGLVAAGAIAQCVLERKGIYIGTHISRLHGIADREFDDYRKDISLLSEKEFAVLDDESGKKMQDQILDASADGDSVGGVLETAVIGMPAGVGEPFFDSVESMLSHALFSIPGIKGVEFGDGFAISDLFGSESNDSFVMSEGKVVTQTNRNGGINGGITNGMPIIFRVAVKPTPSIFKKQKTVNFIDGSDTELELTGRHDPAIVHRARAVVDAATALVLLDMLQGRSGTDYGAQ